MPNRSRCCSPDTNEKIQEMKNCARNPGLPPQSPRRSGPLQHFQSGCVVVVVILFLQSGIPSLFLHASQDPPQVRDSVKPAKPLKKPVGDDPVPADQGSGLESESTKGGQADKTDASQTDLKLADQWIDQLGSDSWEVREKAAQELKKMGSAAKEALKKALQNPDPEVASKAEEILSNLNKPVIREIVDGRDARSGEVSGRRRIISGPGGIVTLDLGVDQLGRRRVEIESGSLELDKLEDPALKRLRELEKQMEQEFQRGLPGRFSGRERFPFPDLERIFDLPGGAVRWEGSTTMGGKASRSEYRNGQLSLSIESTGDRFVIEPMGLVLESVHPALKSHLPQASSAGYVLREVRPKSPAEKVGFRQWNILLRDGNRLVQNENDLATAFRMPRPDRLFEVLRQGQKVVITENSKAPAESEKND